MGFTPLGLVLFRYVVSLGLSICGLPQDTRVKVKIYTVSQARQ